MNENKKSLRHVDILPKYQVGNIGRGRAANEFVRFHKASGIRSGIPSVSCN